MICDSHVHVVGDPAVRPQAPDRAYTAGAAPLATLERLARPHGVERFVVVQPSFYGTDNTETLAAVAALGGRGRAVAVVDPARVTPGELDALAAGGVAGLRVNLYSAMAAGQAGRMRERFAATEAVARTRGWHVEVIASAAVLAGAADLFAGASVPVVVDHYGVHGGVSPGSDTGRALLALLRQPHVWTKLSAPYRSGDDPLAVQPDPTLAARHPRRVRRTLRVGQRLAAHARSPRPRRRRPARPGLPPDQLRRHAGRLARSPAGRAGGRGAATQPGAALRVRALARPPLPERIGHLP